MACLSSWLHLGAASFEAWLILGLLLTPQRLELLLCEVLVRTFPLVCCWLLSVRSRLCACWVMGSASSAWPWSSSTSPLWLLKICMANTMLALSSLSSFYCCNSSSLCFQDLTGVSGKRLDHGHLLFYLLLVLLNCMQQEDLIELEGTAAAQCLP